MSAEFHLGRDRGGARRDAGTPLRMLLLSDCLGDTESPAALGQRTIHRIDLDRFDSVLARLKPRLDLGEHGTLDFKTLDDFHPDSLCRRSPVLGGLLETRRALEDPAQVERLLAADHGEKDEGTPSESTAVSDLERLLGGKVAAASDAGETHFTRYLASLVAPHLVDTRAAEPYRQATEQSLAEQLAVLLHDSRFQTLEASWRGLWWLVTQLQAEEIELYLLPLGRAELLDDLRAAGTELAASGTFNQLFGSDQSVPWSVIVGLYDFDATHADIGALAALTAIVAGGQAALLAGAAPGMAGADSARSLAEPGRWREHEPEIRDRWQALQRSQVAQRVALAAPRLLLRAPYDPREEPIESFGFNEGVTRRSELLWGTGALGLCAGLGQLFLGDEWDMDPTTAVQLEDLASFSFHQDGEAVLQPPTETVLSDQAVEALARAGLTPLMGSRNRIEVVLPGCVSIAGTVLRGPWG
ncbi:MAG: type VI secretion system contractile sheath large subunit [Wenzhouxiangella sp.]|nr:type VI secretion system contractile sheath large subunit [Wenzhouxiangella sp.]